LKTRKYCGRCAARSALRFDTAIVRLSITMKRNTILTLSLGCTLLGACSSGGGGTTGAAGMGAAGTTGAAGTMGAAGTGAAGTGAAGTTGAGGNGLMGATPADGSKAAIAAYLMAETYKQAPWKSETATPRAANSQVSPHGRVRVWMNDTLIASLKAGNGEFGGKPHVPGSMAVKEFYDDSDVRLGAAAMLKLTGNDAWKFYCNSTAPERCGVGGSTLPYYADETDIGCNGCHGGLIFNKAP
jgi:hypothetical protein